MPSLGKSIINKALGRSELAAFLSGKASNAWLQHKGYELYLRKNPNSGNIELANINRLDGKGQVKTELDRTKRPPRGKLAEVIADLEKASKKAGWRGVFVENIHNEFLPYQLAQYGYHEPYHRQPVPQMQKKFYR